MSRRPIVAFAALVVASLGLAACLYLPLGERLPAVGPQRTVMILVEHEGAEDALGTPEHYRELLRGASRWIHEASWGQTWLEGLDPGSEPWVVGPVRLPAVEPGCHQNDWLKRELTAVLIQPRVRALVEGRADEIDRLVFVPTGVACEGFAGQAGGGLGRRVLTLSGRYEVTWAYVMPDIGWSGLAHELIHGLGVHHANGLDCRGSTGNLDECRRVDSGGAHVLSLMGNRTYKGMLDVVQANALGWLSCEDVKAGSYALDALELGETSRPRCLRIAVTGGHLFVEHRARLGLDAYTPSLVAYGKGSTFPHGVLLYYLPDTEDPHGLVRSRLLSAPQFLPDNPCAGESEWESCAAPRAALLPGQRFRHPDGTSIRLDRHGIFTSWVTVEPPP